MPDTTWLDKLLVGYKTIINGFDVAKPNRSNLKITGAGVTSIVDDPDNDTTIVTLAGGGGSVPTGSGLRHITASAEDAAASIGTAKQVMVTNAGATDAVWGAVDVSDASAVTGTLGVNNGGVGAAGGQYTVFRINAGGTPGFGAIDISQAAATTGALPGASVTPDFGAQNILTSGYIGLGSAPATAGSVRLSNNTYIYGSTAVSGTAIKLIGVTAGNVIQIGEAARDWNGNGAVITITAASYFNFDASTYYIDGATQHWRTAGTDAITWALASGGATSGKFGAGVTGATLGYTDKTTNGGTGAPLTVAAQNETGTTSVGGTLNLNAGTGTTRYGDVAIGGGLVSGLKIVAMADANQTVSVADSINNMFIATGTDTAPRALTLSRAPTAGTMAFIKNSTTNSITVQFLTGAATAAILTGASALVYGDGTDAKILMVGA